MSILGEYPVIYALHLGVKCTPWLLVIGNLAINGRLASYTVTLVSIQRNLLLALSSQE